MRPEQDAQDGRPVRRVRHAADLLVFPRSAAGAASWLFAAISTGWYRAIALAGSALAQSANDIAIAFHVGYPTFYRVQAIRGSPAARPRHAGAGRGGVGRLCMHSADLCMHKPRSARAARSWRRSGPGAWPEDTKRTGYCGQREWRIRLPDNCAR